MPLPHPPLPDRRSALFLDLDGTLLDFAETPLAVTVPANLRATLLSLQGALDGALAVLSGRPLAEIDALLEIPGLAAAGIHGGEWRSGVADAAAPAVSEHPLASARTHSRHAAERIPGLLIEDKGSALALHFRRCAHAASEVDSLARELLRIAGSGYALQHGNHVIELKPAGTDKGRALLRFMLDQPFCGRRPWMIGDDLTDESAFERTNSNNGVSVIVGARRPTAAMHALRNPQAVHGWLERARSQFET